MSNNYVAHDCRNSRNPESIKIGKGKNDKIPNPEFCNNRWVDADMTCANILIPTWKYCRECCEKLGIDFDKQKPSDYRTPEQNEYLKQHVQKMKAKQKQNIKSEVLHTDQN